jgi:bifunctional DNase/RNase
MPAVTQQGFIEMQVRDVRKAPDTPPDCYVVLLEEREGERRLAIWIGREQAIGLAVRLEGVELFRPETYAMAANAIGALGGQVRVVRIDRLGEGTFYATVVLDGPQGTAEVDARPSDALNLALISRAPIQVDRAIVDAVLATESGARETLQLWDSQDVSGARAILDELNTPPQESTQ